MCEKNCYMVCCICGFNENSHYTFGEWGNPHLRDGGNSVMCCSDECKATDIMVSPCIFLFNIIVCPLTCITLTPFNCCCELNEYCYEMRRSNSLGAPQTEEIKR